MMARPVQLSFIWPDPDANAVEIELYVARGKVELRSAEPRDLIIWMTPTRLRIEAPQAPPHVKLHFEIEGESPIPTQPRFLRPVLDALHSLSDTPGEMPSFQTVEAVSEEDLRSIEECRESYSEGENPIARARRFFYNLDRKTHRLWVSEWLFLVHYNQLCGRLELRWTFDEKLLDQWPKLSAPQLDEVTGIFRAAGCHLSLREELTAYLWFAAGLLEHRCPHTRAAAGACSANVLLLMELAFAARERGAPDVARYWSARLATLIYMCEVFGRRFAQRFPFSMIHPDLTRASYVVGPKEIEADRAAFIKRCECDPVREATEVLRRRFLPN